MKLLSIGSLLAASACILSCGEAASHLQDGTGGTRGPAPSEASGLVDLLPAYPPASPIGTPVPVGNIPNLEETNLEATRARLTLRVPPGTTNVALGKNVTSSDPLPIIGSLDLITDGDATTRDGSYVELAPGHQWVQIDLQHEHQIWKLLLWHLHKQNAVYFDVNIQLSNDPEFKTGVTTLYNNDHDNSSGLGKGDDKTYMESNHGRLIEGHGTRAATFAFPATATPRTR